MKTILIYPILFLFFGVSEHQTASVEDCDEDDFASSPHSKNSKQQAIHQTKRRNDLTWLSKETRDEIRKAIEQEFQDKRHQLQPVRRNNNSPSPSHIRIRPLSPPKPLNRRNQGPMIWPPNQKPMNLVIKPLVPIKLESSMKRKPSAYPPYKEKKRIKIIPAYDEYDTYPATEYEILYPPQPRAYMKMKNPPSYSIPCDHDDSEYKDLSTEIQENSDIKPKGMDKSNAEDEKATTEKSSESEVQTEKEIEATTPAGVVASAAADPSNIETRSDNIPVNNTPETITNFMEILMRGILAFISCIKSKFPLSDDMISNIIKAAISSCSTSSS